MFRDAFSPSGRIRRLEYGLSYLAYFFGLLILQLVLGPNDNNNFLVAVFDVVFFSLLTWFLLAQGTKRCHDRGKSGWYQLIPFYVFWMLFADGDAEENAYGPNPKQLLRR
ncbi:DUF805 domain-containing protein [Hymenobacter terrestris]|uniref:DUF805 domain-containing protein n=1 Tax=Hymenobacter terrestris TaxID=2748310 RepID=A0ABX2Q6X6_9BACT|nr:DUF805 domain-containing protein [Hymenobacter terrestris]NVO86721.1 DUF805 domain-containing protein [Hymenobacter terrestris]